ncbi:MAG TPA: hypothetical protein H9830_07960 [Candidatus Agrococcus pullicola]|uniref:Uncharacterized protein n=1 Tax=Candidatus Agrococcus pullicola TaxID=2838429 RepID=A0A9D1YW88_9MICO|nr:hypothetical protein [Candidatus Agrococcus pullicola]
MSNPEDSVLRPQNRSIARLRSFFAHPVVFASAALIGFVSGALALWFRLTEPEVLEGLYRTMQLDLRFVSFAFGIVGATGALADARGERRSLQGFRRVMLYFGVAGALLGAGLLVFGLAGALVAHFAS